MRKQDRIIRSMQFALSYYNTESIVSWPLNDYWIDVQIKYGGINYSSNNYSNPYNLSCTMYPSLRELKFFRGSQHSVEQFRNATIPDLFHINLEDVNKQP